MDANTLGEMPANASQGGWIPEDKDPSWSYGLTKREAFAIAAMQGFAADPNTSGTTTQRIAECAVRWADALLAELAREQP